MECLQLPEWYGHPIASSIDCVDEGISYICKRRWFNSTYLFWLSWVAFANNYVLCLLLIIPGVVILVLHLMCFVHALTSSCTCFFIKNVWLHFSLITLDSCLCDITELFNQHHFLSKLGLDLEILWVTIKRNSLNSSVYFTNTFKSLETQEFFHWNFAMH